MSSNRIEILKNLVEQSPADSRTRYMLAMELASTGDLGAAVAQYRTLIAADPDYLAAYLQTGQALERLGLLDEARQVYELGIQACRRHGDSHALSEIETQLASLP
jgi:tetratricopeptide (TPR) repeat protein